MPEPLTDAYLQQCEWDARKFSGAYTGTSGTLAAHVMRLLAELSRVKGEMAVERARRVASCAGPAGAGWWHGLLSRAAAPRRARLRSTSPVPAISSLAFCTRRTSCRHGSKNTCRNSCMPGTDRHRRTWQRHRQARQSAGLTATRWPIRPSAETHTANAFPLLSG